MKNKIIAIVISVVIVAGAGTAIGVIVDKEHDKETVSIVDEAVSKALATTEITTKESTTQATTTEPAATTQKTTEQTTTTSQTETTTTEVIIVTNIDTTAKRVASTSTTEYVPKTGEGKRIKSSEGDYWNISQDYCLSASDFPDGELHKVYTTENNEWFYFDESGNRIYKKDWK